MLGHRKLNVQDYLTILRRRWWYILIPLVIFPILGYATTYFITPQFVSQTLVIIQQQEVPEDYVKPLVSEDLDSRLASMREEILSRSSLKPIIEKYGLYANDKMSTDDRIDMARASIGIKAIHSEIARSNGLPGFYISFKASDAHTAQAVCEEITGLFINQNLLARTATVEDTTKFLLAQQADAKSVLDEQAKKLADFQRQYAGRLPDDASGNLNLLTTLNTQLQSGTEQVQNMESNRAYIQAMIAANSAPVALAGTSTTQTPQAQELQLNTLLDQETDLKLHYTEDYPPLKSVQRKIADLRVQMAKAAAAPPPAPSTAPPTNKVEPINLQQMRAQLRSVDQSIELKRREQDTINQQIKRYQAAVEATPQVEEEFKALTRDNQNAQQNYDQLSTKLAQSKMATDLEKRQQGEQFRIKDPANLPDGPIYPRRSVFVTAGLGAGLAIGLMIVALLEYRDTALRSERDVWAFTQLPTLAVIAWSVDVAQTNPGPLARLKQLFSRKPKDTLADAAG